MPNGDDTTKYVIKAENQTFRIRAPKGMSQEQALRVAAGTNPKFAEIYPRVQEHLKTMQTPMAEDTSGRMETKLPGMIRHEQIPPEHRPAAESAVTMMAEIVGGAAGGAALGALSKAAKLGRVMQFMSRAGGAGIGAAATDIAMGKSGKEAAKTGAMMTAGEVAGEMLGASFKALSRLWKADPAKMQELYNLAAFEERTRTVVQDRAPQIREGFDNVFPKVDTKVRIMPAAKAAEAAEAAGPFEPLPKQVGKVSQMGREVQQENLRMFQRAIKVLRTHAQQHGQDAAFQQGVQALRDLIGMNNRGELERGIDWRKAQQIYSSLNKAIFKGKGMLPDETFHALQSTIDKIEESMLTAARAEGKEAQFISARAQYKQFMDDFYNRDAPLKLILEAKPDERGEVLTALLRDPKTRVRATSALERWGFNTDEIKALAQKYRDPETLHRAIENTARLEQLGEKAYSQMEAAATRQAVGKRTLKAGAGAAGAMGLYKMYELLQQSRGPRLMP